MPDLFVVFEAFEFGEGFAVVAYGRIDIALVLVDRGDIHKADRAPFGRSARDR